MKCCEAPGCLAEAVGESSYCHTHSRKKRVVRESRQNVYERTHDYKWIAFSKRYLKEHTECMGCGEKATVVDHIIPYHIKPIPVEELTDENVQPLCKSCHAKKTHWEVKEFG